MLSASRDVVFTFSNNVARKTGELPRSMAPSRSTIVAFATTRIEIFKVRTLPIVFVEAISRARKNASGDAVVLMGEEIVHPSGMPNPNFERLWKLYLNSFTIRLSLAKQALNGRSSSKGTLLDHLRLTCA